MPSGPNQVMAALEAGFKLGVDHSEWSEVILFHNYRDERSTNWTGVGPKADGSLQAVEY